MNMTNQSTVQAALAILCSLIMIGLSFRIDEPVFGMSVFFARGLITGLALSAIYATVARMRSQRSSKAD